MILHDNLSGGQWHYCLSCHQNGDMIEFAAGIWKLGLPATIQKLADVGFPILNQIDEVDHYLKKHIGYRKRVTDLCNNAFLDISKSLTPIPALLAKFNWSREISQKKWLEGPGQIVGGADCREVEKQLVPGDPRSRAIFRDNREFRWRSVLVMPFYDLPGRPCRLLMVGRKGRYGVDFVHKKLNIDAQANIPKGGARSIEGGLAMHPSVFNSAKEWDNQIIAMGDPIAMVAIQAHYCAFPSMKRAEKALPLVAWYEHKDSRPFHAWQMFRKNNVIIWAPHITPNIVQQILLTQGRVSLYGSSRIESQDPVELLLDSYRKSVAKDPTALMNFIINSSIPWQEALEKMLDKMDDYAVEDLLLQLQLEKMIDPSRIVSCVSEGMQARLKSIMDNGRVGNMLVINGKTVFEREGGWFVEGHKVDSYELIMDANLRIDAIIHQPRLDQVCYKGRVIYQNETIEFYATEKEIGHDILGFINKLLLKKQKGVLCFNSRWNPQIISMAQQFRKPEFVTGSDTVGWDKALGAIVMPNCRLHENGKVVDEQQNLFPPDTPARDIGKPTHLTNQDWEHLFIKTEGDYDAAAVMWAMTCNIVANILAPVFYEETCGIALQGIGTIDVAIATAKVLGCQSVTMTHHVVTIDSAITAEKQHGWPILINPSSYTGKGSEKFFNNRREIDTPFNCVMSLQGLSFHTRKLVPGWRTIHHDIPMASLGHKTLSALKKFLPTYLYDLMKRDKVLAGNDPKNPWLERVVEDIHFFMIRQEGFNENIFALLDGIVDFDEERGNPQALVAMLHSFIAKNQMVITPEEFFEGTTKPAIVKMKDGERIAVPKHEFHEILKHGGGTIGDLYTVTQVLQSQGYLVEDFPEYWLLKAEKWNRDINAITNSPIGGLRVFRA